MMSQINLEMLELSPDPYRLSLHGYTSRTSGETKRNFDEHDNQSYAVEKTLAVKKCLKAAISLTT